MKEVLLVIAQQLNSSVFVLIAILGICFLGVYQIGKWGQKFKDHGEKIDEARKDSERLIRLESKVELIYMNTAPAPNPMVRAHSPISLTEVGKKVAISIEAENTLEKYYEKLKVQLEKSKPKTAYDIQEAALRMARESIESYLNEDELNTIKDEAFNRGVPVEDVLVILGVLLRNHYLKEKGIPISEIDRTENQ